MSATTPLKLTERQAVGLILEGQGLLRRFEDPLDAVRRVVCVQTQYAQSFPVGVGARTLRPSHRWIADAFASEKLVKTWSIRHTLFTMCAEDFQLLTWAFGGDLLARFFHYMDRGLGVPRADVEARLNAIADVLKSGPMTRPEIGAAAPEFQKRRSGWWGSTTEAWGHELNGLAFQGRLSHCDMSGVARFRLVNAGDPKLDPDDAALAVGRRYWRSAGVASVADFRYWTQAKVRRLQPILSRLETELVPIAIDGHSGLYASADVESKLDLADQIPALRALSKFDTLVLTHADKRLTLDPKHQRQVSRKAGQIEAALLVNGRIGGVWRLKATGTTMRFLWAPFHSKWSKRLENELEKEANRVAKSLGLRLQSIERAPGLLV